jgi:citrate lyase subunit beta/citryl-CoA lyase
MASRLLRTALYVPAANGKAVAKASTLGADRVILDLEDSVAPEAKAEARAGLVAYGGSAPVVRVNGAATEWHAADLDAALAAGAGAVLLPKAATAEEIWTVRREIMVRRPGRAVAVWAMIETPAGVLAAPAIAAALGPDGVLVLGLNDLARETGMAQQPGRAPMLAVLTGVVLAARAHGVGVLDGVYNDLADADGFLAECRQGRAFGFDGKTVVHPRQIGPANAVFGPSADEIAEARAIVAAFAQPENAGRGVIALGGRMVERLHLAMAEDLLAKAEAIAEKDGGGR